MSFLALMPKLGKVQMMSFKLGTFGTTWNRLRTFSEQKKALKVPL